MVYLMVGVLMYIAMVDVMVGGAKPLGHGRVKLCFFDPIMYIAMVGRRLGWFWDALI